MTYQTYLRLKNSLIQQMHEVTASREAASRFIDEMGIRDLLVPIDHPVKKSVPKKSGKRNSDTK